MTSSGIRILPSIAQAMANGKPVVALESSVFAQGLPPGTNSQAAQRMVEAVAEFAATPAITGVVSGTPTLGLTNEELSRFCEQRNVSKVSARDLATVIARGGDGATTVAATLTICRATGVSVFATGGIGGVHHEPPFDESADLVELSRSSVIVVCAGAKAILNVAATVERLETLGVNVVGYRTDEFPGFYTATTGIRVPTRVDSAREIATIFRAQRNIGHPAALLVVQPPPSDVSLSQQDVSAAVEQALVEARGVQLRGSEVTPFLLGAVEKATAGRSRSVNVSLLVQNARLAGEIAAELGGSHS